jgi:ATP adenylyltransferase
MDVLHAPWRIDYIRAPKPGAGSDGESLFSRIAREDRDEENLVLLRSRSCFALLNAFPYNGGHLMIVPYRQVESLEELVDEELLDLMRLAQRCLGAVRRVMRPQGFNLGLNLGKCAGAGIAEHLHLHIVPRWEGDTNFMPVLAGTNVVPEALRETAAQLRMELQRNPLA